MTRSTTRFLSIFAFLVLTVGAPPALADPTIDQGDQGGYSGVPDEIQTRIPQRTTSKDVKGQRSSGQIYSASTPERVVAPMTVRTARVFVDVVRWEMWILLVRH